MGRTRKEDRMDREERERRNHVRRWACLMIMHLEGRDADPPRYTYEEALARLRDLLDRELAGTASEPPAERERR